MQERLVFKPVLTLAVAKEIAVAAEAEALRNGWNVVIAIVDDGANLVYLQRMDGTQIASIDVAVAKAASAVKYKRPTKSFEEALVGGRQAILNLPHAMPVEGGLPLTHDGCMVGAIGVSGVQADQDGIIAKAGMNALAVLTSR
jgi:uncharacterized protein GlcG (DUF336 family)